MTARQLEVFKPTLACRARLSVLMASSAAAILAHGAAWAQTAGQPQQSAQSVNSPVEQTNEVVITADAYASTKTIAAKRNLNVISDGISANQIGELPEFGLGDALSSVPGITFVINNGRGEDQFMTIRGLNPDYNSTTIDGMVLPSTEETVRSFSFDVLPAVIVNQANVLKTWTADLPSDAVGGVTDLRTRSAFDHPGLFVSGHLDGAYWEDEQQVHPNTASGQGDFVVSKTFGPSDQFGLLGLVSYYQRSSSTLNTYTLPYSYYGYAGSPESNVMALDQTSATASNTTLKPSQSVDGLFAIPDRHRWYFYDNVRTRPGAFARFDFDDHHMWHAHVTAGIFQFKNDEHRYSQYLNRVGDATIATATTGSFAEGSGEVDFDKYIQWRRLYYVDAGIGADFDAKTHLNFTVNYGVGRYRQNTSEDQFTQPTSTNLGFSYNLATETAPLFTPNNEAVFMNPALYNQVYHLDAVDQSRSTLPQARLDFSHNFDPADQGFGYSIGLQTRDLSQEYTYYQYRLNPVGTPPTLAQIGTLDKTVSLYDGYGQSLLLINPAAVGSYLAGNAGSYVRNASDLLSDTVNNYTLEEIIDDGYAQVDYRIHSLYAVAGLRYETTRERIDNYLPVPFNSQTNFDQTRTTQSYSKLLPSLNVSYTPIDQVAVRGAVTRTLARPEYAQLAENSSATVSGAVASETVSNPELKPRESTNYDLSFEYYPAPGALASLALFEKDIQNEIITLTSTQQGVLVPGYATPVTLTTTTPENANNARIRGVEANLVYSSFRFLPGPLKGLGARLNVALMNFDAPEIRMSDGSFRHLPQLIASSKEVANAAIFYNWRNFTAEVAYNHTSKQPISFDTNNQANDQWWASIDTVDAQLRYSFTPNLDVRIQAKNLTDSRPQKVVGPTQNLNYSTLENGRAYFAGIGFHF
jgi:TonB-dependent receptor